MAGGQLRLTLGRTGAAMPRFESDKATSPVPFRRTAPTAAGPLVPSGPMFVCGLRLASSCLPSRHRIQGCNGRHSLQFFLVRSGPSRQPHRPESAPVPRKSYIDPVRSCCARRAARAVNDPCLAVAQEQAPASFAILKLNLLGPALVLIYEIHELPLDKI
jgi:hypothetical protein